MGIPIVGYDLRNVAYAGGIQNSNVVLSSSTNNGQTWGTPVIVSTPLLGSLADKPWLEIDTNPNSPFVNSLYVLITQFDGSSDSEISVSHSNDGGKPGRRKAVDTKQIYPTSVDQFSDLAVGADGTVYVSWQRCAANGTEGDCGGTVAKLLLSNAPTAATPGALPSRLPLQPWFPIPAAADSTAPCPTPTNVSATLLPMQCLAAVPPPKFTSRSTTGAVRRCRYLWPLRRTAVIHLERR